MIDIFHDIQIELQVTEVLLHLVYGTISILRLSHKEIIPRVLKKQMSLGNALQPFMCLLNVFFDQHNFYSS